MTVEYTNAHFIDEEGEPLRQSVTCLRSHGGTRASVGCLMGQAAFILPHPACVTRTFPLGRMAAGWPH